MEDFTLMENLEIIKSYSDNKKQIDIEYWLNFYDLYKYKDKKYRKLS